MRFKSMLLTMCIALVFAIASTGRNGEAQSKHKCFVNEGLKNQHRVHLSIASSSLSGTYTIGDHGDEDKREYRFTGTKQSKNGVQWRIKFSQARAPYEVPPGTKNIIWRRVTRGKKQVLVIKTYGKNYQSGKYAAYNMELEPCRSE